ncbi:ATP-dependent DNA helicase Hrp3, partial [Linderina pennispora]
MQANGSNRSISSSVGQVAVGQTSSNGPGFVRRIDDTTDTNSTAANDDYESLENPQPRRRLVQGRPSHARVVSDTGSELSSLDDEPAYRPQADDDSDFGGYAKHPPVAMKAPRANLPVVAAAAAVPKYESDASESEGSARSDGDFTMSEIEEDFEVSAEEPESDAFEDSSDDDWGVKSRKRKQTKKAKPTTNKRARASNSGRSSRAGKSQQSSRQRSPEYFSESSESDFYIGKKKPKKAGRKQAKKAKPRQLQDFLGSDSDYGSSDYRNLRQSTRDHTVKNYAEDEGDYPGVDFEDNLDSKPKGKGKGKGVEPLIDEDTGIDAIEMVRDFRLREGAAGQHCNEIGNLEFYIKWKGWSYRHATWDTAEFLKDFKGYKKVENYFKATVLLDYAIRNDPE